MTLLPEFGLSQMEDLRFINGSFPLTTCGCKIKTSNDAGFYFTLTYQQLSKWFNPISDTVDVYATVWGD